MFEGHDSMYKKLFENHHLVEHLLKSFVGLSFVGDLDFSKMISIDKSFIDERGKNKESDKVYKIDMKGRDVYIYIMIEFQSTVDKTMPMRFLRYLLDVSETYGKRANAQLYPAVFPILLYNGDARWSAEIEIFNLFEQIIPREFIPRFQYFPIIINQIDRDTLKSIHNVVSAVFMIENSSSEEYHNTVDILGSLIQEALPDEIKSFARWLSSKFYGRGLVLNDDELDKITEPREVYSMFLQTLDEIEAKGIEKGIEKTAANLLKLGIKYDVISKATGLTEKELKTLHFKDVRLNNY